MEVIMEVWGDFACFSKPEGKVERLTYPVPTPSAVRGILSSVYAKPREFVWQVNRIEVLNPIRYISFKRNEVKSKVSDKPIFTDDDRYLSTTSLAQFESKLGDFGFFRVHRRYIVNLACVEDVETAASGAIQLGVTGVDDRIPVSRRRVVPLKKALNL